jgi:hypothetical protein
MSEPDFHRRFDVPQSCPFRSAYSASGPRRRWISQVPDASFSGRAVLLDPAAVSSGHRQLRPPTVAFQVFDPVGLRMTTHEAQSLHLRYGLPVALPTLSSCRYLHKPKARFPVGWLGPLPGREFHPLDAPSLTWRADIVSGQPLRAFRGIPLRNYGVTQRREPAVHRSRCSFLSRKSAACSAEVSDHDRCAVLHDCIAEQPHFTGDDAKDQATVPDPSRRGRPPATL